MCGGTLKNPRGQSSLEFALILPVIIIVIFSLIQLILYLLVELNVCQAARNGAREGATTNNNSAIYDVVSNSFNGNMDGVSVNICPSSSSSRRRGDLLRVIVEKKVPIVMPGISFFLKNGLIARHETVIRLEKE